LEKLKEIIKDQGLDYPICEGVQRTLDQFSKSLEACKVFLDKEHHRLSAVGAFKNARFAFCQDEVSRLRDQISMYMTTILHLFLNNSFIPHRGDQTVPIAIPAQSRPPILPLGLLSSLGRLSLSQSGFPSRVLEPESAPNGLLISGEIPMPPLFESLRSSSITGSYSPSMTRPQHRSIEGSPRNNTIISGLVLPQSALPYLVAEVYFGTKKVSLKRKLAGRDFEAGREIVIVDQDGNLRFNHRSSN
jgi:hypothetical protein